MYESLRDQRVVIIGARSGIGLATAELLNRAGAILGTLADSPTEATRTLVDSKFWGQYFTVKNGRRHMTKAGSITLFSGTVTRKPIPGTSAFAAVGSAIEAAGRI